MSSLSVLVITQDPVSMLIRTLSEDSSHILAVFWLSIGMEFQKVKPEGTQVRGTKIVVKNSYQLITIT